MHAHPFTVTSSRWSLLQTLLQNLCCRHQQAGYCACKAPILSVSHALQQPCYGDHDRAAQRRCRSMTSLCALWPWRWLRCQQPMPAGMQVHPLPSRARVWTLPLQWPPTRASSPPSSRALTGSPFHRQGPSLPCRADMGRSAAAIYGRDEARMLCLLA